MIVELSIAQAKQHPGNFMYIWADEDKFLQYIPKEYAAKIRTKKANEIKLLKLSAEKYGTSYEAYTSAIREAFIEAYQMTPAEALVKLANGEQVVGKNWSEGVFGVGAIVNRKDFKGTNATVNTENGVVSADGVTLGVTNVVY